MCCLFSCFAWMIDFIQRLWTFTMSCCISSAVCFAFIIASMSGVALGYNYSLAEYIDLKETNVPIYLKRGIFDVETGNNLDRRRSSLPVAGRTGESNLRTEAMGDDPTTIRSGEKNDSILKLTAKTPASISKTTVDEYRTLSEYSMGSTDQVKAIKQQSLVNQRKSNDAKNKKVKGGAKTTEGITSERYQVLERKANNNEPGVYTRGDSSPRINKAKWKQSKLPLTERQGIFGDYGDRPTYPMRVTPRTGPVRTRPKSTGRLTRPKLMRTTLTTTSKERHEQEIRYLKPTNEEMDWFKQEFLLDKSYSPSSREEIFMKNIKGTRRDDDDYEDAAGDDSVRNKRENVGAVSKANSIINPPSKTLNPRKSKITI